MEHSNPKLGERVAVICEKQDGSVLGGTEGFVVGVTGDEVSGKYLVIDRSTYQDSLKAVFFSLGILDLKIIPFEDVKSVDKMDLRKHPSGLSLNLKWNIEIDYRSNLDYHATIEKVQQRGDCKIVPNQPLQTDGLCTFTIRDIATLEGVTVGISPHGNIQITCLPMLLEDCVKWLQTVVEIWPGHNHLVLIPTNFMFNVHDIKQTKYPKEELIDRIAEMEGNEPIIFPLGWIHEFFAEFDENPLHALLPNTQALEKLILTCPPKKRKKSKSKTKPTDEPTKTKLTQPVRLVFPQRQLNANQHLGAKAPIMRLTGQIKTVEEEAGLIQMWRDSRFDTWQWFNSPQIQGKMLIHDLTIDKKTGIYTVDLQKYSGGDFEYQKQSIKGKQCDPNQEVP